MKYNPDKFKLSFMVYLTEISQHQTSTPTSTADRPGQLILRFYRNIDVSQAGEVSVEFAVQHNFCGRYLTLKMQEFFDGFEHCDRTALIALHLHNYYIPM